MADPERTAQERERILAEAVGFYGNPETYFAIGIFPDRPSGPFADDFEELEGDLGHPGSGGAWTKPGKRARETLKRLYGSAEDYHDAIGAPHDLEPEPRYVVEHLEIAADHIEALMDEHEWERGETPDPAWLSLRDVLRSVESALARLPHAEAARKRSKALDHSDR